MNVEQNGTTVDANPGLKEMHQMCLVEESLINKLDMKDHRGYVTDDQLKAASLDKNLSASERHTAELMLKTEDDLRYQRLGYLPHSPFDGPVEYSPWDRPKPELHSTAGEEGRRITLDDVKSFDKSLTVAASKVHDKNYVYYSDDIMDKYARVLPDKLLLPSEVSHAVDTLSKKPNLTKDEKQELEILKYSQEQMNEMHPKGPEPTNHQSVAYHQYKDNIGKIPMTSLDLLRNSNAVMTAKFDPTPIWDTYSKLHPMGALSPNPNPNEGTGGDREANDGPPAPAAPADNKRHGSGGRPGPA